MDHPPESPEHFYCPEDGFCAQAVGSKSLVGGYRKGNQEIRFEVSYRPYFTLKPDVDDWCVRLLDWKGVTFSSTDNSNVPSRWIKDQKEKNGGSFRLSLEQLDQRNDLILDMYEARANFIIPEKRGKAWEQVLRQLDNLSTKISPSRAKANAEGEPVVGQQHNPDQINLQEFLFSGNELSIIPTNDEEKRSDDDVIDESPDGQELLSVQNQNKSGLSVGRAINPLRLISLFKKGKVFPAELIIDEENEFHQTLVLYSQPVKAALAFGHETRKHHSGADISVYVRRRNSQDPWRLHQSIQTGNHGTKAGAGLMRPYATCDKEFPITKGYYAWKGECDGEWGSHHVCNDDTAYQIWHAYGNWREGAHCYGRRRFHRPTPWCDEPWPSRPYGEMATLRNMPGLPEFSPSM